MAKLGDMSHATLYSACTCRARHCIRRVHVARVIVFTVSPWMAKDASDKRATCPPSREGKKRFCCLPETFWCLSLQNFVVRYKVSNAAKLGDIEGTCHWRQCQARHGFTFSQAFTFMLCHKSCHKSCQSLKHKVSLQLRV